MTPPASAEVDSDVWSSRIFCWSASQINTLNDFRERLRSYDCRLAKYLADVRANSPGGGFRRHDIHQLETLIIKEYGQSKCLPRLRILDNLIVHLNRVYQKSIPRSQLLKSLEQANVFLESSAAAQRSVHQWLLADSRWATRILNGKAAADNVAEDNITPAWEMVVASAALHCGIDNLTSAMGLVDALCNPQISFASSPQREYGDLPLTINLAGERLFQRWYPDRQLIQLISRVRPDVVRAAVWGFDEATPRKRKREIGAHIFKGIVGELLRQGVAPQYLPSSFPNFLSFIEQAMRSELPAIFVDFAAGKLPARSLLSPSMGRITGDPVALAVRGLPSYAELPNESRPEQNMREAYDPVPSEGKGERRRREPDWLRELRHAFGRTKPAEIEQTLARVNAKSDALPPVAKQIISLAYKLIRDAASTGNEWAPSSVKCCVLSVACRFAVETGAADPSQYKPETLEEIYVGIVANAALESRTPARLQRTVAWALREYQRHIVCYFGANPVNEGVAFRYPSGPLPVDARVISLDDLYDVIAYIKTAPHEQWLPRYRQLAIAETVLAFLGSARRMEGFGLTPHDHLRSLSGLLLIRENDDRDLKTSNAARALFLSIFAHPFTELVDYVSEVFEKADENVSSIFDEVSEDVIIPIIHEALQKVTNDPGCHLHSLRHSFGHWTLFRLLLSELRDIPDLFPHLPKTRIWLRSSREFRELLYGNGLVANDHAWATAVQMGHAHPARTSIPTYFHGMDLLLSIFLEENRVFGSQDERWSGGGRREKDSNRRTDWCRKDEDLEAASSRSGQLNAGSSRVDGAQRSRRTPTIRETFRTAFGLNVLGPEDEQAQPKVSTSWIKLTENAMYMAGALQMECSAIAQTVGLDPQTVAAIAQNARTVAGLKWFEDGQPLHAMKPFRGSEIEKNTANIHLRLVRPLGELSGFLISRFADQLDLYVQKRATSAADILNHVARNMLPNRASVVFLEPNPCLVRNCVALFQALGFPLTRICAYTSNGTKNESPTRRWLKSWGLSWRWQVTNQTGRSRRFRVPQQWLVLEPKSLADKDANVTPELQKDCLCYTLVMAAIRFGSL